MAQPVHLTRVSSVPVFGHDDVRSRLRHLASRDALPASLLLHGARGIGKQRLARWLAALLLCERSAAEGPCGGCASCRYSEELAHPDLLWVFPRPRLKDADADTDDVLADLGEAIAERRETGGLYAPAGGTEGLYVSTVRAILKRASLRPALGRRKVIVVGDAERLVPQEGADQAANAFLKLLEEPPADTQIVLTSSEPGALLPTIRSRVVALHVPPVGEEDVRRFLADPRVVTALAKSPLPPSTDDRVLHAAGAPGMLLAASDRAEARANAERLLRAATGSRAEAVRAAFAQGASGARGGFAASLDELTRLLHARARDALRRGDERAAHGAARAVPFVERARQHAQGNVSPQLLGARLVRELSEALS